MTYTLRRHYRLRLNECDNSLSRHLVAHRIHVRKMMWHRKKPRFVAPNGSTGWSLHQVNLCERPAHHINWEKVKAGCMAFTRFHSKAKIIRNRCQLVWDAIGTWFMWLTYTCLPIALSSLLYKIRCVNNNIPVNAAAVLYCEFQCPREFITPCLFYESSNMDTHLWFLVLTSKGHIRCFFQTLYLSRHRCRVAFLYFRFFLL